MLKLEAMRIGTETPAEPTPEQHQLDEWIATAEAEERWDDARSLKLQRHQQDLLNPPGNQEIDSETRQRITDAEEAEDYAEAMRLKVEASGVSP